MFLIVENAENEGFDAIRHFPHHTAHETACRKGAGQSGVWLLRAGSEQEKGEIVMLTIELNMYHAVALGAFLF